MEGGGGTDACQKSLLLRLADPDTRARQGVQSRLTPLPRSSSPFSRSSRISVGLISRNLSRAHGNRKDVARRARYRVRNRPGLYVPFLLPFCCPSLLVLFSGTLRVLEMKARDCLRPSSLLWQRELTNLQFPFLPPLPPSFPSPFEQTPPQPPLPPNALRTTSTDVQTKTATAPSTLTTSQAQRSSARPTSSGHNKAASRRKGRRGGWKGTREAMRGQEEGVGVDIWEVLFSLLERGW